MNRLCADVSDGNKKVSRELALDDQIPRFDVATLQQAGAGAAFQRRTWKGDAPAADVNVAAANHGYTGRKGAERPKAVCSLEVRTHGKRVEATKWSGQGQRINRDSEAGPHHGVVVDLIGQSDSRSEELLAGGDPQMIRIAADAAEQHLVCREVITVKPEGAIPRHERIVFVPEAERDSQLGRDSIAVSNKPPELPFPCCGFDELIAPSHADTSSATEIKLSARTSTQFRLPVVQVVMDDVRSGADLVLAVGPPDVVVAGEAPVVAERGVPSFGVTNVRVTCNREVWKAAAAQVRRIISPGNPQHVRSDVCTKVRSLPVLAHASKADVPIDDKGRRQSQCVTHGDQLYERMEVTESTVTGAVSNRLAKTRLTVKHRLHGAVLGKDAVPGRPVPIHLAVKVVAIQTLRSRFEIVSRVARPSRRRNQSQYFRGDRANWNGGLVRKRRPSGSVRVSGGRVIDNCPGASEVSGSKGRSRHGLETSRSLAVIAFEGSVVAAKEEELILLNGPTEGAA